MSYYSKQEKAAYILSEIKIQINKFKPEIKRQIASMYNAIANFEIIANFPFDNQPNQSNSYRLAKVAMNIVRRGCPTISPCFVEKIFNNHLNDITPERIKRSLIIYDPAYSFSMRQRYYQKNHDGSVTPAEINNTECKFLCGLNTIIAQHMEVQRSLENIIECPNTDIEQYSDYARFCLDKGKNNLLNHFAEQRIDFSLIIPEINQYAKHCLDIEIDGPQHEELLQKQKDEDRDCLMKELLWAPTLRITNIDDSSQYKDSLRNFMAPMMEVIETTDEVLDEVILPVYIARVTMAILKIIEQRIINPFGKNDIKIQVIANSSAHSVLMGVVNAFNIIRHLGRMVKSDMDLPNVFLEINERNNSDNTTYLLQYGHNVRKIEQSISAFDITIVEAMNRRINMFSPINEKRKTIYIYSAYAEDESPHIEILKKPIKYNISSSNYEDVEYFLQNIFHKEHFRPKQFDIVMAALNRENVIGVLPTGSGKTITYQLPALLQPSMTMVISPLVSLMVDQIANLNKNGINNCTTINGMIKGIQKRYLMNNIIGNKYQIIYISPERLQIKAFKEILEMLPVSEIVLDEAHCVSQWGHDFRTSYLRVGKSVGQIFNDAVIMALTGTASCNVITDIKRELSMKKNVNVITPTSFRRNELHFKIMEIDENLSLKDRIGNHTVEDIWDKSVRLFSRKWSEPLGSDFYDKNGDNYKNAGIIFCPFAKKRNESVEYIYERLYKNFNKRNIEIGKYHGQCNNETKKKAQQDFINGKTAVLIATKAFGMGIDKPNIRITVHTTVPESIESFYQEAGRAGRDGKPALNVIISPPLRLDYADISDRTIYEYFFEQSFPDKEEFKNSIMQFMDATYLTQKNFSSSILESIKEDELEENVSIQLDRHDGKVNVDIGPKARKEKYRMTMSDQGEPHIQPKNPENSIHKNILFRFFEKYVLSAISNIIKSRNIKKPSKFEKAFEIEKFEIHESLLEMLKKPDFDKQYCFIGLNDKILDNPIDCIMRDLIRELNLNGKTLIMNQELVKKIEYQRNIYNDVKKRFYFRPEKFLQLYNEVRVYNREKLIDETTFVKQFNGSADQPKTHIDGLKEKIIYYLGLLGVYDEYERSYSPNYIKIRLRKVDKEILKANIRKYIGGYETRDYLNRRLGKMSAFDDIQDNDIQGMIKLALNYIIDYAYDKIKTFRHMQAEVMYRCMQANDPNDENVFIDEIYKYFESKYADRLLLDVQNENLNLAEKWINIIETEAREGKGNIKENLSHLRASALKTQEARPQAFTPYFLYAYCSMADPDLEIKKGIDAYINGVKSLKQSRANYHAMTRRLCDRLFASSEQYYLDEVERLIDISYNGKDDKENLAEMIRSLKAIQSSRKEVEV